MITSEDDATQIVGALTDLDDFLSNGDVLAKLTSNVQEKGDLGLQVTLLNSGGGEAHSSGWRALIGGLSAIKKPTRGDLAARTGGALSAIIEFFKGFNAED